MTEKPIYSSAEISEMKFKLKNQPSNYIRYQVILLTKQIEERKVLLNLAEQELLKRDEG